MTTLSAVGKAAPNVESQHGNLPNTQALSRGCSTNMQSTPLQLSKPQIEPFGPNLHDGIVTTILTGRPALQQFCLGLSGKNGTICIQNRKQFIQFFIQ